MVYSIEIGHNYLPQVTCPSYSLPKQDTSPDQLVKIKSFSHMEAACVPSYSGKGWNKWHVKYERKKLEKFAIARRKGDPSVHPSNHPAADAGAAPKETPPFQINATQSFFPFYSWFPPTIQSANACKIGIRRQKKLSKESLNLAEALFYMLSFY